MPDADGYGYSSQERGVKRLLEDLFTLSAPGIERIAAGWDAHVTDEAEFEAAVEAGNRAINEAGPVQPWADLRKEILNLTEGRSALHDWKAEHGDIGHKAERATLAAALALSARDLSLPDDAYDTLVAPMAEALPWLKR